jgi:hypothetical protein
MGVDLTLKKGKHEIFLGRAYHYADSEAKLLGKLAGVKILIAVACTRGEEDVEDNYIIDLFNDYEEIAGKLRMRRFIDGKIEEGYKEVKE